LAGRTSRYTNFSVIIPIPFNPLLFKKILSNIRDVKSCEYWFEKASLYQNLLESGKVKNLSELARLEKVSKARISQIMCLNNLAPEIKRWLLTIATETTWNRTRTWVNGLNDKKLRKIATIRNHKQQIKKFREFLKF
jgi:Tfp pilus assembly major pilin PilA